MQPVGTIPYFKSRNCRRSRGAAPLSSCQVRTLHRVLRSGILTHFMIAYHASIRSGRRPSSTTQKASFRACAARTLRMSWYETYCPLWLAENGCVSGVQKISVPPGFGKWLVDYYRHFPIAGNVRQPLRCGIGRIPGTQFLTKGRCIRAHRGTTIICAVSCPHEIGFSRYEHTSDCASTPLRGQLPPWPRAQVHRLIPGPATCSALRVRRLRNVPAA